MAKAKKQKNGTWRVQVFDYTDSSGKRHYRSFTENTKAAAEYKAAEFAKEKQSRTRRSDSDWTVAEAVDKYIELKQLLSPTTLDSYRHIRQYAFQDIMQLKVSRIDNLVMQSAVNREANRISERTGKKLSAKTLKNEYGLISSALRTVCGKDLHIGKIESQKHIKMYPEPEQVIRILKGTDIELPCLLAMWLSFSMSEIRGLQCSDVFDGYITINRVLVDTKDGPVIKENAKVDTRLRMHELPNYILSLINCTDTYIKYSQTGENGPLIDMSRDQIVRHWKKLCKANGLDLTFHDLRHMSASVMLLLNVPEKYAMERGGWKTPNIMKSVYQHTLSLERRAVDAKINNYFDDIIDKMQREDATQKNKVLKFQRV